MANVAIVDLIRRSEEGLRDIKSFIIENKVDDEIRKNVHYSLAIQLKDLAQQTKKKEKEFITFLRSQYTSDEPQDDENGINLIDFDDDDGEQQDAQLAELKKIQNIRSQDIDDIVKQTNDLAALFKELSVLVIEQGTILDRIDYNIEEALQNTKEAKKELIKAKDHSESNRAKSILL